MFKIESKLNVLELLNPISEDNVNILSDSELLEITSSASNYINSIHSDLLLPN